MSSTLILFFSWDFEFSLLLCVMHNDIVNIAKRKLERILLLEIQSGKFKLKDNYRLLNCQKWNITLLILQNEVVNAVLSLSLSKLDYYLIFTLVMCVRRVNQILSYLYLRKLSYYIMLNNKCLYVMINTSHLKILICLSFRVQIILTMSRWKIS